MAKEKSKKVIGLTKYKLARKIRKFVGLIAKTYSYLRHDGSGDKKAKGTKKCVIKKNKLENYKNCLETTQLDDKTNYLEKMQLV